jgi:predicted transcriptional regulator
MSIDILPAIQSRLLASAEAEGLSLNDFLERLIDEREELASIVEEALEHHEPLSQQAIQEKIERGYLQSERGEVMDGDTFVRELRNELEEMARKRRAG